jgi:uncharacterized protein (TIGR03437 family)
MRTLLFLFAAAFASAQPFQPRTDYGALLEPRGVIVHGAGQDPGAFARYQTALPANVQPLGSMEYISLRGLRPDWADSLRDQLWREPARFVIPQIGLSMTVDGQPSQVYEDRVAAGEFDTEIGHLITGLRRLATPVYLRIGYEFNGASWNGYRPTPFKAAYRRIAERIRAAAGLEIALVWCSAIDGTRNNIMEFYPGDDVVDWFAIDIFSANHFADPDTAKFVADAAQRRKPVMLGETTPRGIGAQRPENWGQWFEPFFTWMRNTPQVKHFNYINWDWADAAVRNNQPGWANWGDARIETPAATEVRQRYAAALNNVTITHGNSESAFRRLTGSPATPAPDAPSRLRFVRNGPPGHVLDWLLTGAADSDIGRYYVYRNGVLTGFSTQREFTDETAPAGNLTYEVAAINKFGVLGPRSTLGTASATLPRVNDPLTSNLADWRLESFNAAATGTLSLDAQGPLAPAMAVRVNSVSGTVWHLQARKFVWLNAGQEYRLEAKLASSMPASVQLVLQQISTNTFPFSRTLALTTSPQTVSATFRPAQSGQTALALYAGNAPAGATVWLRDVQLTELATPALAAGGTVNAASFSPQTPLSPNSFFSIFGRDLSIGRTGGWESAFAGTTAPTSLNDVSVTVNGRPAFVAFTSPGQLNVLAPDGIGTGPANVVVTVNGVASSPLSAQAGPISPALFRYSPRDFRYPAATANDGSANIAPADLFAAPPPNGLPVRPAKPGEVILLYATGLGPTNPAVPAGRLPAPGAYPITGQATLTLAGNPVPVLYAGLSAFAGVYQIAFAVPDSLPAGDHPLILTINGQTAGPLTYLPVAR